MQASLKGTTQLCLVYDPIDGKILHLHSEFTADGRELQSEEEVERLAVGHARRVKPDITNVRVAHMLNPRFTGWPRRVNPTSGMVEFAVLDKARSIHLDPSKNP